MHRALIVLYFVACVALLAYTAAYLPLARRAWLWPAWFLAIPLLIYAGVRAW